jgi:hypothetical protein
MNCPDHARSSLNAAELPDTLKSLRQFSQAEAQLLGSVNYCFFPSSLFEASQSQGTEETPPESAHTLLRVPR